VRVPIVASAIVVLLFVIAGPGGGFVGPLLGAIFGTFAVVALTRFGLVALVAFFLTMRAVLLLRVGLALGAGTGIFLIAIMLVFVAGAAWVAMGSPRIAARTRP